MRRIWRRIRVGLAGVALLSQLAGCGAGQGSRAVGSAATPSPVPSAAASGGPAGLAAVTAELGQATLPIFRTTDGRVVQSAELAELMGTADKDLALQVDLVGDRPQASQAANWGFNAGRYRAMVRWHAGRVSCFGSRDVWHLDLHLKDRSTNRDIVGLHLGSWWDRGPQAGVFNGANGYCRTTEGKFTAIREAIQQALQQISVPQETAYYAAAVAAAIVVAVFGLSFA